MRPNATPNRSATFVYAVALAAVSAGLVIRWLLDPLMGNSLPLVTLFGAIAIAVWIGGIRPALLATALGYIGCAYLFIPPRGQLGLSNLENVIGLFAYLLTCSIIIGFGEAVRITRRRAEVYGETLQVTFGSMGDAVIITDTKGLITSLNPMAESVTGWDSKDSIGQPLDKVFRIVNEQTRKTVASPAARALREGIVVGLANHTLIIRKDGSERPIDDSAAPILDRQGHLVGCVLIFRDISERRGLEKQIASQLTAARFLAAIIDSSNDAIVSKSLEGIIQSWNASAQRLFGYTSDEAVGQHISMLIPEDRRNEEDIIISRIRAGEPIDHFDTIRRTKDGAEIPISLTISPIRDESGRVVGASKIARDISDRKESEAQTYRLLAELKQADRNKDEFLAILAHELRGPLAPLRNMLEIIKRTGGNDEVLLQARNTMERQLDHLVRLVDDLIDVSRITRNKIELRRQHCELASIMHQAVEACRPLTERANQQVNVTLPARPVYLNADPIRLAQVFFNLVNNACKYSDSGSVISVSAELDGTDVVVKVKDNGAGIPKEHLENIFDMFSQVERTLDRSQGGLGIGLTLVKRLVEMHGGSVSAHSEGPGTGSEFSVRLPVQDTPCQSDQVEAPIVEKSLSRRFLVVDDNVDAATSLAMLLKIAGNETEMAYDGLDAVEKATKHRPDVILLDIGLPKLNGYEACRKIRERLGTNGVTLIALTGWGQEEDRRKSQEAGFDFHMVKPVDFNILMRFLNHRQ